MVAGDAEMKKSVGIISGTALIVGTMIGSGLFISPKGVLEGTGSVGLSLIVWALCGALSTLGALAYAELGTSIPQSGGEHAYLMFAFGEGKREKNIGRIAAFLFDWVGLFILRPTMLAVVSLALGTYAVKPFFPDCQEVPDLPVKIVTILSMLTLAAINMYSVKMATFIQTSMTVIKLIAVLIIVIGGVVSLAKGNVEYIAEGFEDTTWEASLAIAFYNGLWAYEGWNNLNFVTEEMQNPSRHLPICIMLGIPLTTLAYVLTNVGYLAVMSKEEVLASHAVAVTWGQYVLGHNWIMPVFVALSCFGAANGVLFATSRYIGLGTIAMSVKQLRVTQRLVWIITFLRIVIVLGLDSEWVKQVAGLLCKSAILGICTVIPGDLRTLIDFYSFSLWLAYGATMVALLYLRYSQPDLKRPYRVPTFIPVIVLLMSLYLTISPVIQTGRVTFLYAIIFIISGVFVFFPFVYHGRRISFLNHIYRAMQIVFEVIPPVEH